MVLHSLTRTDQTKVCDKFNLSYSRVERRGDAGGYYNCHSMCETGDWQDPIFKVSWLLSAMISQFPFIDSSPSPLFAGVLASS